LCASFRGADFFGKMNGSRETIEQVEDSRDAEVYLNALEDEALRFVKLALTESLRIDLNEGEEIAVSLDAFQEAEDVSMLAKAFKSTFGDDSLSMIETVEHSWDLALDAWAGRDGSSLEDIFADGEMVLHMNDIKSQSILIIDRVKAHLISFDRLPVLSSF